MGDKVFAEDPETGEQGFFEVVALTNHPTDEVLQITIDAEDESSDNGNEQLNSADTEDSQTDTMEITPDHPVYVEGKGWLNAENLSVGDELRRSDGGVAKVLTIERVKLDEPQEVYNFTVKGPHTYFVLSVGVLVHNVQCDLPEHIKKREQSNVVEYKPGLYEESADPLSIPHRIEDNEPKQIGLSGLTYINTKVIDEGRRTGLFTQLYDQKTNTLEIKGFFRNKNLNSWIQNKVPLVSGKGTPLTTMVLMHQMNRLEIPLGSLRHVEIKMVVEHQALLELATLGKLNKIKSTDELKDLVKYTHSVSVAKNPIIQSGHKIDTDSFRIIGGTEKEVAEVISGIEDANRFEAEELRNFAINLGLKPNDKTLVGYDIVFDLQSIK